MRQQQFRVQTRGFDAFFTKEVGALLDGFEDGHADKSNFDSSDAKPFCRNYYALHFNFRTKQSNGNWR